MTSVTGNYGVSRFTAATHKHGLSKKHKVKNLSYFNYIFNKQ